MESLKDHEEGQTASTSSEIGICNEASDAYNGEIQEKSPAKTPQETPYKLSLSLHDQYFECAVPSPISTPESGTELIEPDSEIAGATWKDFLVEPFMFIYIFSSVFSQITLTNLFMERGCLVNLNYTSEICSNLSAHPDIQDEVQIIANNTTLYNTLIVMIPASIFGIFIGPWSDKYGRISPVLLAVFGNIIQDAGLIVFVIYVDVPVEYSLLASIPLGCFGGMITVMGALYSLASEKSVVDKRTIKYALLEAGFYLGMPFGSLASGQIYKYYGNLHVYSVELILHVVAFFWVLLLIKDNRLEKQVAGIFTKLKDFFSIESMQENMRTCLRERINKGRAQLWWLIISMCCTQINYLSIGSLLFLYSNKMYNWTLPYFTVIMNVAASISIVLMSVMIILLTRVIKTSDIGIGMIGMISLTGQTLLRAFSYHSITFNLALVVGCLNALTPLAIRAKLSGLVDKTEIGKVFAIVAICENIAPLPSTVLFTIIYNSSISYYPGLAFLCSSVLCFIPIVVFLWIMKLPQQTTISHGS